MNPQKLPEGIVRIGLEAATLPLRITREVGHFAVERVSTFLDGGPNLVESRLAEMPLNEAKIASQQIDIAENRLDFPTVPVTVDEVVENKQGERIQKAMKRDGINRLARALLYAEANPIVPDEITDEVVAIATDKRLNPERLDDSEFQEIERKRISKILTQRQGHRPAFSARQLVRAFFRP